MEYEIEPKQLKVEYIRAGVGTVLRRRSFEGTATNIALYPGTMAVGPKYRKYGTLWLSTWAGGVASSRSLSVKSDCRKHQEDSPKEVGTFSKNVGIPWNSCLIIPDPCLS